MKPTKNRKPGRLDLCQTPSYALEPLIPHLKRAKFRRIWECASGEMYLANALADHGFDVIATDILYDDRVKLEGFTFDFFEYETSNKYDVIVTNPPYSMKPEWVERCYELGKPWALLMPVEFLGTVKGGEMFNKHRLQVIFMYPRINFKMPNKGWDSTAQFPTAWFTWGLNLPRDMMFVRIKRR